MTIEKGHSDRDQVSADRGRKEGPGHRDFRPRLQSRLREGERRKTTRIEVATGGPDPWLPPLPAATTNAGADRSSGQDLSTSRTTSRGERSKRGSRPTRHPPSSPPHRRVERPSQQREVSNRATATGVQPPAERGSNGVRAPEMSALALASRPGERESPSQRREVGIRAGGPVPRDVHRVPSRQREKDDNGGETSSTAAWCSRGGRGGGLPRRREVVIGVQAPETSRLAVGGREHLP